MFAKRRSSTVIALLAGALLLVGVACGDNGGDGDGDNGGDEDTGMQMEDMGMADTGTDDTGDNGEEDTGTEDTGSDEDTAPEDTGGMTDTGDDPDGGPVCTFIPDSCGDGDNCYLTNMGRQCAPYGDVAEGESCSRANDCDDGLTCVGMPATCRAKCDPADTENYGCDEDYTCIPLGDGMGNRLPYGACQPSCTHFPDDSCPDGENCYPTQSGGDVCASYTEGASLGDDCQMPTDCGNNQYCNPNSGTCAAKCDGDNPCEEGSCQMSPQLPFGVCTSG